MTNQNAYKREIGKGNDAIISHPEFISGSLHYNNEMLNQVQHDEEGRNEMLNQVQHDEEGRNEMLNQVQHDEEGRNEMLNQVQHDVRGGFTLIELLVVVLIIGILASVALPQYTKAVQKARAAEIVSNVNALSKSAEMYFLSGRTDQIFHDDAEVPLTGCVFDEDDDDHMDCYTNTADYNFECNNGRNCAIETYRVDGCIVNGAVDDSKCNDTHNWTIWRQWSNGQMTVNKCITQETDTGRAICKSLEAQGFEYVDSDY